MGKIYNYFGLFLMAFLILCLMLGVIFFYNMQSSQVQSLALEAMTLLADWNRLENRTNQLLLGRYTIDGTEVPPVIEDWVAGYTQFSRSLEELSSNNKIQQWDEMSRRFAGASRVWRYTEVQLNNARYYFTRILQSGLGEKVMVNGFLHTMYKLRMMGLLQSSEVFLLDDTINALESLDRATDEFDILLTSAVGDLEDAGELYLRRIRVVAIALFSTAALILVIAFLINRQLKTAQESRAAYLKEKKSHLLRSICENCSEENLELFRNQQSGLGFNLDLDRPILPVVLQIDDYTEFSHRLSISEQEKVLNMLTESVRKMLGSENMPCDSFLFREDMIVFLANPSSPEEYDRLLQTLQSWHKDILKAQEWSVTMTMGNINTEAIDLDSDFSDLLKIAEYRFLTGKSSFIYSGSAPLGTNQLFRYPLEKEKHFEEALNSLDLEETLRIMDEMIQYGLPYGPRNMQRLILRLTASLASVVENLERTYHITSMKDVTPLILQVQNPESIDEVRQLLTEIASRIVKTCREKKEEKHDQTVLQIKEIIAKELRDFNLSADSIADRFNLTSSYLNRLFKQHTSLSIAGYINEVRLDHAEELLRTSGKTVSEIAELSGFASMGTFFRLFKKKIGRTPRDYQREMCAS